MALENQQERGRKQPFVPWKFFPQIISASRSICSHWETVLLELVPPRSEMIHVGWAFKLKFCKNEKYANSFENVALKTTSCAEQASPHTGLLMN